MCCVRTPSFPIPSFLPYLPFDHSCPADVLRDVEEESQVKETLFLQLQPRFFADMEGGRVGGVCWLAKTGAERERSTDIPVQEVQALD